MRAESVRLQVAQLTSQKHKAQFGQFMFMAFSSKFAVSLYENLAQLAHLSHKTFQEYSLDEFRALLGVPPGRYKTFGELNKHVLKPTVQEINAIGGS